MITILVDHDMEGQAIRLWGTLAADGWLDLLTVRLTTFENEGLSLNSTDREVWRFAQSHNMVLLTNNRNMKDEDSLEITLREENTDTSLPVLTISNINRIHEKTYRQRCAVRLIEVVLDLNHYLGTSRIFIP